MIDKIKTKIPGYIETLCCNVNNSTYKKYLKYFWIIKISLKALWMFITCTPMNAHKKTYLRSKWWKTGL